MALIAIPVWDTVENDRTKYTIRTLHSLRERVNLNRHRVFIIDNNSCKATKDIFDRYKDIFTIITLEENIGIPRGANIGWQHMQPKEHCVRMDNDVVVNEDNWLDKMEDAIECDQSIGMLGLKRKDLPHVAENKLHILPHKIGQPWIMTEESGHIMGTCIMYNYRLIEKTGFQYFPKPYGYEDALGSLRSNLAGFKNAYLPAIDLDHIDVGGNKYTQDKIRQAQENAGIYLQLKADYESGKRNIYEPFN